MLLGRKDSNISGGGSEPDSLLDLYGNNSANRSRVGSFDLADKKSANGSSFVEDEDPERSRWIHRDKLARIESEELQRAGIHIGRANTPDNKMAGRRERTRDEASNALVNKDVVPREEKRQRVVSPIRPEPENEPEDEPEEEPMTFDLRMPAEAAADPFEERTTRSQYDFGRLAANNPSYSRIPLPKSSPIPIPVDYLERHTPLQRRASSDDHSIAYKSRSRSQSMGSQILLDDGDLPNTSTPTPQHKDSSQASPTKSKVPSSKGPVSGGRKASISKTASGQRTPSRPGQNRESPGTRPTTRSGEIKRPEGDPPWLASMYKPDPSLPPDQQLLPTVAKRLQQEQWERDGKFGDMYDRELNPINVRDPSPEMHLEPDSEPEEQDPGLQVPEQQNADRGEWPLGPSRSPVGSFGRPGTSGTNDNGHGGYKTMPTVGGRQQSPTRGAASTPIQSLQVHEAGQAEEGEEEEGQRERKGKGGTCGCCVIM